VKGAAERIAAKNLWKPAIMAGNQLQEKAEDRGIQEP
jgi:hypothetical protein